MLHVAMVTHAFHFQEQNGDHIVGLHMRLALEELFYVYKVNLHLAGHLHRFRIQSFSDFDYLTECIFSTITYLVWYETFFK